MSFSRGKEIFYLEGNIMRSNDELFYFLAGVTVGVIAALLITPYSGEETRQYLRERVDEGTAMDPLRMAGDSWLRPR